MLIRNAQVGDVDQLIELCELHAKYERVPYDRKGKHELLKKHLFDNQRDLQCLVLEGENELQGYATFIKQFSTWDVSYYLYLDCIYLREEVRGMGYGRKLMNQVKEYAQKEGHSHVQWQTPDFNKRAIKFYRSLGATCKSKERFYWT